MPVQDSSQTGPFDIIRHWHAQRTQKGWWHSFELPDGAFIEGVCGLASLKDRIARFPSPRISVVNGFWISARGRVVPFKWSRRGADGLAIDSWANPLFHEINARVQRFDVVLFMGVLYHLITPAARARASVRPHD